MNKHMTDKEYQDIVEYFKKVFSGAKVEINEKMKNLLREWVGENDFSTPPNGPVYDMFVREKICE